MSRIVKEVGEWTLITKKYSKEDFHDETGEPKIELVKEKFRVLREYDDARPGAQGLIFQKKTGSDWVDVQAIHLL